MWDASLYRMRAKCYENSKMIRKAIADMRTVTKLVSDSTQAFLDVSLMYYAVGDVEESLGLELRIIILIFFLQTIIFSSKRDCKFCARIHKVLVMRFQ